VRTDSLLQTHTPVAMTVQPTAAFHHVILGSVFFFFASPPAPAFVRSSGLPRSPSMLPGLLLGGAAELPLAPMADGDGCEESSDNRAPCVAAVAAHTAAAAGGGFGCPRLGFLGGLWGSRALAMQNAAPSSSQ
jgi:hypothetical protein